MKFNTPRHTCLVILFSLLYSSTVDAQQQPFPLIPYPTSLEVGKGSFVVTPATAVRLQAGAAFKKEADALSQLFMTSFGKPLPQRATAAARGEIRLQLDPSIAADEGYRINITPQLVVLAAKTPAGMFRAVQTVRQLLPAAIENSQGLRKSLQLPALRIEDQPAFAWRGMHLDVSRHFFSMAYLRKLIDRMALYKYNKFHLHLTDDQGWRVEIKKYPKLTTEGAWRTFNNQDSVCMERAKENPDFELDPQHLVQQNGKTLYGGFYTQEELKDLVAYAASKHIEIVPEIDMPGHMMAAINAYNYLSCDGKPSTFGELFSAPICPCNPSTLQFAEDVLTEILAIFPSPYIHIGGDEVDRSHWEASEACQALMQKEGLKTTAELQSWFIRKIESFLQAKGRKLVGWDEILEGGISKTAAVMYWRTWEPTAPLEAARNGNSVIMTPVSPFYFSEQPHKNSLAAVYHYPMVPPELSAAEAKQIVGGQGALWTEYIPTERRADYLYMPRMTALAESLWTGRQDYPSYLRRLQAHYPRLDRLGVNYRLPDLPVLDRYVFTDSLAFHIEKPLADLSLRYTLDGSTPGLQSPELKKAVVLKNDTHMHLAAFKKDGTKGDVYEVKFQRQAPAPAVNRPATRDGLLGHWYNRAFDSTVHISGHPDKTLLIPELSVPKEAEAPAFTLQFRGYLAVPQDGIYTFYLTSDDASVLRIADREVVNNDGMHPARERSGQVALQKGLHRLAVDFIEGGGGYTFQLLYSFDGAAPKPVPPGWLKHE